MARELSSRRLHAAVVYQPLKTQLRELWAVVQQEETRSRWLRTHWYETEAEDAGVAATRQALADGASVVLASGGDGTIRAVAEALRGTGVPLVIVPQGTGNLLARNLGMPLSDLKAAVRAAFHGEDRPIDLGLLTITREDGAESEHVFLVLAGMGLDARAIRATRSSLKKHLGWLAYVDAGVRTIIKDRPLRLHYSIEGSVAKPLTVYTVMIGNCGLMPGGVMLIPNAQIDDGKLDVVALKPLGAFSWLRIWHKLGWEHGILRRVRRGRSKIDLVNDTSSQAVTYVQTRRFALSTDQPEPIQLDGDDFGLVVAAACMVDPGALTVRVLPEWEAVI